MTDQLLIKKSPEGSTKMVESGVLSYYSTFDEVASHLAKSTQVEDIVLDRKTKMMWAMENPVFMSQDAYVLLRSRFSGKNRQRSSF